MDTPSEIIKGLWVGSGATAMDTFFFKENNIKAVLNCTTDLPNYMCRNNSILYKRLPVDDTLKSQDLENMYKLLPEGVEFIDQQLSKNKHILVHCHAGIQRSPTIVTAYLCTLSNESLEHVLNYIILRRHVAFFGGKRLNFYQPLVEFLYGFP